MVCLLCFSTCQFIDLNFFLFSLSLFFLTQSLRNINVLTGQHWALFSYGYQSSLSFYFNSNFKLISKQSFTHDVFDYCLLTNTIDFIYSADRWYKLNFQKCIKRIIAKTLFSLCLFLFFFFFFSLSREVIIS